MPNRFNNADDILFENRLGANKKWRPLVNKEFSLLESVYGDNLTMTVELEEGVHETATDTFWINGFMISDTVEKRPTFRIKITWKIEMKMKKIKGNEMRFSPDRLYTFMKDG